MAERISVVVSSTSRDLPEHRQAVMDAILRLGMFPIGYENLSASQEDAVRVSLRMVDEADIYVGIFAFRYGYVPDSADNPSRLSIVELEYRRAVERGIERLIFIADEKTFAVKSADAVDVGEAAAKLKSLKQHLMIENIVGFFGSPDDLKAQVIASLARTSLYLGMIEIKAQEQPTNTVHGVAFSKGGANAAAAVPIVQEQDAPTSKQAPSPTAQVQQTTAGDPIPLLIGSWRGAGNDRVAKEDQLEFKHYVSAFADLLEAEDTTPPVTIGIYGAWGAGKSFLLNAIQTELDSRYAQRERLSEDKRKELRVIKRVHTVNFNAWEYNATEVIWAGLVRKIMDSLVTKLRLGSFGLRLKRVNYNLRRQWKLNQGRLFGQVLLWFVLAAALVVVVSALGGDLANFGEIAVRIFGVGSVFVVFNLLRDVIASPASQWITALFEEGNYGHQIGYMADIHSDLSFLDKRLKDKGERVLITIDDLDRCEPRKAVEVLQAINLLLNFDSFIVILGIDARIITGAISKYYSNLLEGAGASGYEYLDKIIQIPFRIPQPNESEIRAFLSKQLGDPKQSVSTPKPTESAPNAQAVQQTTPADPTQPPELVRESPAAARYERQSAAFGYDELRAFHDLAPMLRANPRHLKRMVNIYRLVRSLAEYRSNDPVILENPTATVRWLVLAAQWSYTSSVMLRCYDELCEKHSRDQVIEACGADDPLEWLYGKAKPLLKKDLADKLDDDLDQLAKLLKKGRGQIDWRTLDSLRRYTINFNPAVESESVSTEALKLFEDDLPEIILPPE